MPSPGLPFYDIADTELAACLATLGIEFDPTQPYSHSIDSGTGREMMLWWFRARSRTDNKHVTEELAGAWLKRAQFERDYPAHPLVHMRAGIDARRWFLGIIKGNAWEPFPCAAGVGKTFTPFLREAAILRAHGFPLVHFTGRAWNFPAVHNGRNAEEILSLCIKPEGREPAQWQHKCLVTLDKMLNFAKGSDTRVLTREENRTLNLSANAPGKVTRKFFDLL